MARKVFTFPAKLCSCVLEHPYKAAQTVAVKKVNRTAVMVEPLDDLGLSEGDCISVSLKLKYGPKIPLLARVRGFSEEGTVLTWLFGEPEDADKLEKTLLHYVANTLQGSVRDDAGKRTRISMSGGSVRVDAESAIRSKALTICSSTLAARHEKVQVLDMKTINDLIQEAVEETVESFGKTIEEEERGRLLEEAEENFKKKLQEFKLEKESSEARAWKLQTQLSRAQSLLKEEQQKVVDADQFTVSAAGMEEIERRLSRMLDRALKSGGVDDGLEQDMRSVLSHLLDEERERIRSRAQEVQNDKIQLLERKISRLARTLEGTECERDHARQRAHALESSGGRGLFNVMTPGLAADDPDGKRKRALLKQIFEENKAIRDSLTERGTLPPPRSREESPEVTSATEGPSLDEERTEIMSPSKAAEARSVVQEAESAISTVKRIEVKRMKPPPLERAAVPVDESKQVT